MSFQVNIPPSQMAKIAKEAEGGDEGEEEPQRKKREDYKKLKELEEMRKAGTAPAMKDEEGKDINPHIPQYIMQVPWYFGVTQATLKHQRRQPQDIKDFDKMADWYQKGVKEGPISTKFRKGSCENCGAMTHKKKDCLERPRKVSAKFTGTTFAPDEYHQPDLDFDFEGKRDRWNGYDVAEHRKVVDEHQKIEEAKKVLKAQKLDCSIDNETGTKEAVVEDDDEDEDKYVDDVDMPGQKFETKQRITVRNLRIREDTAKYLYNLDVNSAHYDSKTRSMRENPFEGTGKSLSDIPYAGDNFVRYSGDAMNMSKQQLFAWEAYEKGADVHLQADPTKLEMLAKEFKKRKLDYKTNVKDSILDKYGGQEHLDAPSKQLLLAQSEDYVEYSRHGTVIKGQEKAQTKSCYEEDVYINNHTCVWGSYWVDGKWGFACCHSLLKESYCTGDSGKQANMSMAIELAPIAEESSECEKAEESEVEEQKDKESDEVQKHSSKKKSKKKKKKHRKKKKKSRKESSDESSEDEDAAREKRIQEAMQREEKRITKVNQLLELDERKRPYNSMFDVVEPTEDDIEAFHRKRKRDDDPMARFM